MTKKKTIWAFVLALCLIVPAMFVMTACGNNTVEKINGTNSIVAEGKFEKGSTLLSDKVETSDSSYSTTMAKISDKEFDEEKVAIFDITLANSNGSKIQPDGKVKITMPKPFESEHGYVTYHIKDETTVEELETTLNGANIVFETESFSYFVVVGKVPPTNLPTPPETSPTFAFSNTHADSLEHLYNGAAVFVSKDDLTVDGTKLSEITDEDVLSRISYVWRDKNTKATVTPDKDITLTGEINTHYGVNSDITIGNEIAGPCVVGEYEFVLSYNGTDKLVIGATITESSFQKITEVGDFEATTAPTIFGEICYYTIVGYANGQMYVMQMPADSSSVASENVEAQARLVDKQEDGSLVLGGKFDFVFTPMNYFYDGPKYYPSSSNDRKDLLVDFCTGYYGAIATTLPGTTTPVVNRIGWTSLSGDKIARHKEEIRYTDTTYGNLAKFAEDGAVTIYAPRKGETENNALRLVKNSNGSFAFTGVDKTTDTRESFPVYVYKQYVKKSNTFNFTAKLDKQYDGNAVQFNCQEDLIMTTESGEDIGAMLKMETVRFVFKDLKDNIVMTGSVDQEDGTVTGPAAVGQYKLVIQFLEKGETGNEWVDKAVLNQFEIYSAS